jgi:CTP:molybdopterin cytidylyltransferase MocA
MSTSVKKCLESFEGEAVMLLLGDMTYVTEDIQWVEIQSHGIYIYR